MNICSKLGSGDYRPTSLQEQSLKSTKKLINEAEKNVENFVEEQTHVKSVDDIKNAAQEGNKDALFLLGELHATGSYGVKKDLAFALKYYILAADNAHQHAKSKVLEMCMDGRAAEVDKKFALGVLDDAIKLKNMFGLHFPGEEIRPKNVRESSDEDVEYVNLMRFYEQI